MAAKENGKITTIKLKKDTKLRLDHFKEYKRESYEEILLKMLHILNTARNNPEGAQGILRNIDIKLKRKQQVYDSIPKEVQENPAKLPTKAAQERQEKRAPGSGMRNKFMIRKVIRK